MLRNDLLKREDDVKSWVANSLPKAEIAKRLNCNPKTVNSLLEKWGITYKGNQGSRGRTYKTYKPANYYIDNNKPIKSDRLKQKLIRDGLKKPICEQCGNHEWMGKPIPLELHHVDGDHYNNELTNLQLLCPNCHAFTENYRGRNTKLNTCLLCEKPAKTKFCSIECSNEYNGRRRTETRDIPVTKEELYNMLLESSFSSVGRHFSVSDNAIRNWCKYYNLSTKAKDYK